MSDQRFSVLIVEDEFLIAESLRLQLKELGLDVCGRAATAEAAVALAHEHRPALVLMDVRLRGRKDGIDAALAIKGTLEAKVVFITGSKEPETLARIALAEPTAILFKPFSNRELQAAVNGALPG